MAGFSCWTFCGRFIRRFFRLDALEDSSSASDKFQNIAIGIRIDLNADLLDGSHRDFCFGMGD